MYYNDTQELDIELARWGDSSSGANNADFVNQVRLLVEIVRCDVRVSGAMSLNPLDTVLWCCLTAISCNNFAMASQGQAKTTNCSGYFLPVTIKRLHFELTTRIRRWSGPWKTQLLYVCEWWFQTLGFVQPTLVDSIGYHSSHVRHLLSCGEGPTNDHCPSCPH